MKTEWRRLAPLGLVLAFLAAITSIALAIIYRTWGLPLQISTALTVVGLALFGMLDPDRVRISVTGRQARYGSNALILSVAFVGILVVINYLVVQASTLYPEYTRWDLTADKSNSLAPETLNVLAELPAPVHAKAFFSKAVDPNTRASAEGMLEEYETNSKGKLTFEFIDPDEKPLEAKSANIPEEKDAVISLQMGDRHELISSVSEQEMTSGLVKLLSNENRVVYFLTGHGEHSPDDTGELAYSQAKSVLVDRNYTVNTLNLRATQTIPDDAKLIIVAGPTQPVSEDEVKLLIDYVAKGGALIVMEDPTVQNDFGASPDPLADYLATTWGLKLGNDFVVQVAQNKPSPYISGYDVGPHPISEKLKTNPPVFIGLRSVTFEQVGVDTQGAELILTSPFFENCYPYCSWASTDLADITAWLSGQKEMPNSPSASADLVGPVSVAAAAENSITKARVVVIGDSDFAADSFYKTYGNSDLLTNSVDWAVGQDNLINLTSRPTTERYLDVPPLGIEITKNLLLLGLVFGLPFLVILAGVVSWVLRRRRG